MTIKNFVLGMIGCVLLFVFFVILGYKLIDYDERIRDNSSKIGVQASVSDTYALAIIQNAGSIIILSDVIEIYNEQMDMAKNELLLQYGEIERMQDVLQFIMYYISFLSRLGILPDPNGIPVPEGGL